MSWWSSSQVETEIMKATSSSIPSGEQDLALNLEISDSVRSKQADSKVVLKALRKRLYDRNPNVQILALHLSDLLVKNGGNHFLAELTSKEFIDAYVAQLLTLQNQNRSPEVVQLMLEYLQTWALASGTKPEAQYLRDKYEELKRRRDLKFPDPMENASELSSSFLESETAPEWADSDTCMKSGQPFTFYNRKHHCRNCGGVFLQEYCSNFRPLPHYGINIPVRICTDCDAKLDQKYASHARHTRGSGAANSMVSSGGAVTKRHIPSNNADIGSKYRDDLAQAINLSLNASKNAAKLHLSQQAPPASQNGDDDMDEDMRRAIEASLADLKIAPQSADLLQPGPAKPANYESVPSVNATVSEQSAPPGVQPALPPKDKASLEELVALVQTSSPHDAIYNQHLISLNQTAIQLQPKIIAELRASTEKLSILEDLNGKMLAVSSYYDRLLDAELSPELGYPVQQQDQQVAEPPAQAFVSPRREENHGYAPPIATPAPVAQREAYETPGSNGHNEASEDRSPVATVNPPTEGPGVVSSHHASQPAWSPKSEPTHVPAANASASLPANHQASNGAVAPQQSMNKDKLEHGAPLEPQPEPEPEAESEPEEEPNLIEL